MDSPSWYIHFQLYLPPLHRLTHECRLDVALSARYPPYTAKKLKTLGNLTPGLPARPASSTAPKILNSGLVRSDSKRKWYLFTLTVTLVASLLMTDATKKDGVLGLVQSLKASVIGLVLGGKK